MYSLNKISDAGSLSLGWHLCRKHCDNAFKASLPEKPINLYLVTPWHSPTAVACRQRLSSKPNWSVPTPTLLAVLWHLPPIIHLRFDTSNGCNSHEPQTVTQIIIWYARQTLLTSGRSGTLSTESASWNQEKQNEPQILWPKSIKTQLVRLSLSLVLAQSRVRSWPPFSSCHCKRDTFWTSSTFCLYGHDKTPRSTHSHR